MPDKRRTALDWEDVRYFIALARLGTLSATARSLRVSHATVARRIASLEALLGKPLFERRPYGYALTAEGKAVLEDASTMERGANFVHRRLQSNTELNGLVRLTSSRALGELFVTERLAAFHQRYPGIDLELVAENQVVSLAHREADIALRFGAPKDSSLIARRVGTITLGLYASRSYRDKHSKDAPVMIGYNEESDFIPEASWLRKAFAGQRFAFRGSSQASQAAAARAGLGVALLPRFIAANDPDLVQMPLKLSLPDRAVWLLLRRDLKNVPRVRAVADYLVELFRRERKLLSG
jgi:DNA-binding transcriptional LysR family regulator